MWQKTIGLRVLVLMVKTSSPQLFRVLADQGDDETIINIMQLVS